MKADREIIEEAKAKVNLTLEVTGRRADGYHTLQSMVMFARFHDTVHIKPDRSKAGWQLTITMEHTSKSDESLITNNLILRAIAAYQARFEAQSGQKMPIRGGEIILTKRIPIGGGLGGGSADAAATLRAINALTHNVVGGGMQEADLQGIGLTLGADIPMCLVQKPCIVRGVGEEIKPLHECPDLPIILLNPGQHVPTKKIFNGLKIKEKTCDEKRGSLIFRSPADVIAAIKNHENHLLESACCFAPEIKNALTMLKALSPPYAGMSGSGSTCFAIFETTADRDEAMKKLTTTCPKHYTAIATLLEGCKSEEGAL